MEKYEHTIRFSQTTQTLVSKAIASYRASIKLRIISDLFERGLMDNLSYGKELKALLRELE